jgi:hypothetical protein
LWVSSSLILPQGVKSRIFNQILAHGQATIISCDYRL